MAQKNRNHLTKSEVGTSVPTSDGDHPRQSLHSQQTSHSQQTPSRTPLQRLAKRLDYHIPLFWPLAWLTLMLINIIFGLLAPEHDLLILFRVGGIALCLLYVAKIFPKDYLLLAAMFTTCISDIILAFNNTSEFGLITFLATQFIHLFRLADQRYRRHIAFFAGFSAILILLDLLFSLIPLLFLVVSLYAVALTLNVFASFKWQTSEPDNFRAHFAFLGFVLFACCDLMTAVSYLSLIAVLPAFFYVPANFLAWFFYYPSQILISNSSKLRPPVPKPQKSPVKHEVSP